jgi:hypothetical protein
MPVSLTGQKSKKETRVQLWVEKQPIGKPFSAAELAKDTFLTPYGASWYLRMLENIEHQGDRWVRVG